MTHIVKATRFDASASERLHILGETLLFAGAHAKATLKRRYASDMVAKAPRDYQTEIDVAVERVIVERLVAAFPDHAIKGEEQVGNRDAAADKPIIYIDPIDGTTNFAWGIPHFGMTLAIVEGGEVVCGAVYDPMQDELFTAEKGAGAFLNGEAISCATPAPIEDVVVGAGLPIPGQVKSVPEDRYFSALKRLMNNTAGVRRLGSSALSVAYVACARLDGFFEDGLSLHDYGASALILKEAGGIVTGFTGGPVSEHGDVLAATPSLHTWLLQGFEA